MSRIVIVISLLVGLIGCATDDTNTLLKHYKTSDDVIAVIGKPNYKMDNRYVWRFSKIMQETVSRQIPYTTYTTQHINGHIVSIPQTNYRYEYDRVDVLRECELVLVEDNEQQLIFKEATGNYCSPLYSKVLTNDLIAKGELKPPSKAYVVLATLFYFVVTYGGAINY